MKVEFHSLCWNNLNKDLVNAHHKVMQYFDIDMKYTIKDMEHCFWLDEVMQNATSDVVVIIEPDCIPLTKDCVNKYIKYSYENETFVGLAQVANHYPPATHIYAAPSMFIISTSAYKKLGRPSFQHTLFYDVGELVSYKAEMNGVLFKCLMPTYFEKLPSTGIAWRIGSLACYGIGTVFNNEFYHLYESRKSQNIELFIKRCDEVINGTFSTSNFLSSYDINYPTNANVISSRPIMWRLRRVYHFIKERILGV